MVLKQLFSSANSLSYHWHWASLLAQSIKTLPAMQETQVPPLGLEDPLEKGMATRSSILAWRIPWTEEPDELQSMGSQSLHQPCNWPAMSDLRDPAPTHVPSAWTCYLPPLSWWAHLPVASFFFLRFIIFVCTGSSLLCTGFLEVSRAYSLLQSAGSRMHGPSSCGTLA